MIAKRIFVAILLISGFISLGQPANAAALPVCDPAYTVCGIPENLLVQFPGLAIAGDVILTEPGSSTVSDIFRIFNDIIDTGGGTGFGDMAFLYSADDEALPSPSSYSANAVFIAESSSVVTPYVGNGTLYLLGAPEPATASLLLIAILALFLSKALKRANGVI